jgi:hypothetical protein
MKINKLQHDKLTELMANISNFSAQYGSIENILIMENKSVPNTVFVKYDKTKLVGGEAEFSQYILELDAQGKVKFIQDNFDNMYQKYAFLGDCAPITLNNLEIV